MGIKEENERAFRTVMRRVKISSVGSLWVIALFFIFSFVVKKLPSAKILLAILCLLLVLSVGYYFFYVLKTWFMLTNYHLDFPKTSTKNNVVKVLNKVNDVEGDVCPVCSNTLVDYVKGGICPYCSNIID